MNYSFALLLLLNFTLFATQIVSAADSGTINKNNISPTVGNPFRNGEEDETNNKAPDKKGGNIIQKNADSNVNLEHDTSDKTLNSKKKTNENMGNEKIESKTLKNISWNNEQESGILTKGMMMLLIISLFFMMFVAYKTYRRKSRYARIKKYGVRLSKGNVEMRPLPLDNEDEDETIFDLKNVPT